MLERRLRWWLRWLRRIAVEIGNGACHLGSLCRSEFIRDRAGETFLGCAAPPSSAPAPTAPRSPIAALRLIRPSLTGLFLGLIFVGIAFFGFQNFGCVG